MPVIRNEGNCASASGAAKATLEGNGRERHQIVNQNFA
jgi:hypothetical protein